MRNRKIIVLITAVSRKVQLIKSFRRVLESQLGPGEILGIDMDPLSSAFPYCDRHFIAPRCDSPEFSSFIIKLCEREKVDLIIPTIDEELPIFASWKETFARKGITILISDLETTAICNDKYRLCKYLENKNVTAASSFLRFELTPKLIKYPLFIKPRYGKGSAFAYKIDDEIDLRYYVQKLHKPVIQEFLKGPEYTIDVLTDFFRQHFSHCSQGEGESTCRCLGLRYNKK